MEKARTESDDEETGREVGQELAAVVRRAENGDSTALPALREILDANPHLLTGSGNLALQAEESWLAAMVGDNLAAREALKRRLEGMRCELSGQYASPLERLLVERVVACWLQLQYADALFAQRMSRVNQSEWDYFQRFQDRTHKRYLSAIRTLAQVRRLRVPTIQVNVADQQINMVK